MCRKANSATRQRACRSAGAGRICCLMLLTMMPPLCRTMGRFVERGGGARGDVIESFIGLRGGCAVGLRACAGDATVRELYDSEPARRAPFLSTSSSSSSAGECTLQRAAGPPLGTNKKKHAGGEPVRHQVPGTEAGARGQAFGIEGSDASLPEEQHVQRAGGCASVGDLRRAHPAPGERFFPMRQVADKQVPPTKAGEQTPAGVAPEHEQETPASHSTCAKKSRSAEKLSRSAESLAHQCAICGTNIGGLQWYMAGKPPHLSLPASLTAVRLCVCVCVCSA